MYIVKIFQDNLGTQTHEHQYIDEFTFSMCFGIELCKQTIIFGAV